MAMERILGTETGKSAFEKTDRNVVALDASLTADKLDLATHKTESVSQVGGVHGLAYEEGQFNPVLVGSSVAGSHVYGIQKGYYQKLGKQISVQIYLYVTTKDANMAGSVSINGLPFVAKNNGYGVQNLTVGHMNKINYGTAKEIRARIVDSNSKVDLMKIIDNADMASLQSSDVVTTSLIQLSGTYQTN